MAHDPESDPGLGDNLGLIERGNDDTLSSTEKLADMKILCISSIFLFIVLHSICEGKFYFTGESTEMEEDDNTALRIFQGEIGNSTDEHLCKCSAEDCECCYLVGIHSICSMTKIVTLVDEGNELAIQGKLTVNNGSVFTFSIKLKEIPKVCYYHKSFDSCFDMKHKEVEDNKLMICGHIKTRYSTTVLLNIDLFCKTFEVKKAGSIVREPKDEEDNEKHIKSVDRNFLSHFFSQFALQ